MSDPLSPVSAEGVRAAIRRAADATGVDFSLLVETARRESAFNPTARAGASSAAGLFQFIESTWLDMVRRHGPSHGLANEAAALRAGADSTTRGEILALRNNAELSARMAGELARENAQFLRTRLGRAPGAGELYAAHVLGPAGAAQLIEAAAGDAPDASALFPREASANRGLFFVRGEPRSAQGLLDRLSLDASTRIGEPTEGVRSPEEAPSPFSPALAQALFTFALLPLLRTEEAEDRNALRALTGYARFSRS